MNMRFSLKTVLLAGVSSIAIPLHAAAPSLTQASPTDPTLPSSIPEGYVVTPFGFFHPSCVRFLEAGESVVKQGLAVQRADGSERAAPACEYPRFTRSGARIDTPLSLQRHPPTLVEKTAASVGGGLPGSESKHAGIAPELNAYTGWVQSVSGTVAANRALMSMTTRMTVPSEPENHGATVFLFPGAQPLDPVYETTILQPVIGWNGYSDNQWTIASWHCCANNLAHGSHPVEVSPGDVIVGTMKGATCNRSTGICPRWTIDSRNATTGENTTLVSIGNVDAFDWVFGGVLEVYDLQSCDQLPPERYTQFNNTSIVDVTGRSMTGLVWQYNYDENPNLVDCGYTASFPASGAGRVNVWW